MTQALACERAPEPTPRQANPCAESHYCMTYGACHVAAEGDGSGDGGEESSPPRDPKPWLNPETNPHGRTHREPGNREPRRFELEDGTRCVIEKDADCRRALWSCRLRGRCTASEGRCVADTDADCEQAYRCRRDGWCKARDGRCVAGSDADCEASEVCEVAGRCEAYGNFCTYSADERRELVDAFATDTSRAPHDPSDRPYFAWYRQNHFPTVLPRVTPSDVGHRTREPTPMLQPGDLVPDDDPYAGAIGSVGDSSEAERTTDSGAADAGREGADAGGEPDTSGDAGGPRPLPPCSDQKGCLHRGWCDRREGKCVPTRDAHCRESHACLFFGRCEVETPGNRCVRSATLSSYRQQQMRAADEGHSALPPGDPERSGDLTGDELIFWCRHAFGTAPTDDGRCRTSTP